MDIKAIKVFIGIDVSKSDHYVYEVMTLVTCAGTRVAGGWLPQVVWGRW